MKADSGCSMHSGVDRRLAKIVKLRVAAVLVGGTGTRELFYRVLSRRPLFRL